MTTVHSAPPTQGMADDLRRLNDVLACSPLAGRYWMFGGIVLGWAREGGLMAHDSSDADFAFLGEDIGRFEATWDALFAAGFAPLYCFPGNDEPATEYSFSRDGRKFDFFRLDVVGERFRYHNYALHGDHGPIANVCEIPAQPLEEIRFLGRHWLKTRDHDVELTALYGDWRTPNPDWDYLQGPAIVQTRSWNPRSFGWSP